MLGGLGRLLGGVVSGCAADAAGAACAGSVFPDRGQSFEDCMSKMTPFVPIHKEEMRSKGGQEDAKSWKS